jgi:hypothetical protein
MNMKVFAVCLFAVFAVTLGDSDVTFKIYNDEGGCHGNKVGEHLMTYDSDDGTADSVNLCAEKCSKHAECNYFTFGHGNVKSKVKEGQCHLLKSCTKVYNEPTRTAYIMGDYVETTDDSDAYQFTEVVDSDGTEGGCGGDDDRFINHEKAPYQGSHVGAVDTQECANKCGAAASQGCLYFSISDMRGGPGTETKDEYRCHLLNECHAHLASKKWKSYKMTVHMESGASDATSVNAVGYDMKLAIAVCGCVAAVVLGAAFYIQKVRARKSAAEVMYAAAPVTV